MDRLFLDAKVLFSAAYRSEAGLLQLWKLKLNSTNQHKKGVSVPWPDIIGTRSEPLARWAMKQESQVTRRGFMQLTSGALAAGGVLTATGNSDLPAAPPTKSDPMSPFGKIALEEHFDFSGT